jgi:predicted RNase H-like nuclease
MGAFPVLLLIPSSEFAKDSRDVLPPTRTSSVITQNRHTSQTRLSVGVDGCKGGWIAVSLASEGTCSFALCTRFGEVCSKFGEADIILVDIPIGFVDEGSDERECDRLARMAIGARRSSVFPVPCRKALLSRSYDQACAVNRRVVGRAISRQTWNIIPKMREVDEYLGRAEPHPPIREMHPEVCFWALAGFRALAHGKLTPKGHAERISILRRHVDGVAKIEQQVLEAYPRTVGRDDILDALCGAVTGLSPALSTLPSAPATDAKGKAMEVVYRASTPTSKLDITSIPSA